MDMERKDVLAEVKELNDKGEGVLRFIRFEQEDKDGDITRPGFIGRQEAILLPAHNWKSDYPPLGRGESFEADGATNFRFKLNMADPRAQNWYSWLKMDQQAGKPLQQISYGFSPYADATEKWHKEGRSGRYLNPRKDGSPGAELREISFVVLGSGNDTAILDLKSTDALLSGTEKAIGGPIQESRSMQPEDPIVEPPEADGAKDAETIEDYTKYAEDRRPPLPMMIKWLRMYRYHMPFLQDIRKRDGKEVSPETIGEFKTLVEEMIDVGSQLNIQDLKSRLLPSAEEEELLRQQYNARASELSARMNAEQELAYKQLQAKAEDLAREARVRQARMKEVLGE